MSKRVVRCAKYHFSPFVLTSMRHRYFPYRCVCVAVWGQAKEDIFIADAIVPNSKKGGKIIIIR